MLSLPHVGQFHSISMLHTNIYDNETLEMAMLGDKAP